MRTKAIFAALVASVAVAACGKADSKAPTAASANNSASPAAASAPVRATQAHNYKSREGDRFYYVNEEDGTLIGVNDLGRLPQNQDFSGHMKMGDRAVAIDGRMFAVVSPGADVVHVLYNRPGEQILREVAVAPLSGDGVASRALRDSLAGLLTYPSAAVLAANQPTAPVAVQPVESAPAKASFDCAKASTLVERTICGDPALAAKDSEVSTRYRGWLAAIKAGRLVDDASEVTSDQRAWVIKRNACRDAPCISAAYDERLGELPEAP